MWQDHEYVSRLRSMKLMNFEKNRMWNILHIKVYRHNLRVFFFINHIRRQIILSLSKYNVVFLFDMLSNINLLSLSYADGV